jgi:hypothetical protein
MPCPLAFYLNSTKPRNVKHSVYLFAFVAYSCLLIAMMNMALWITLSIGSTSSFEELKQEYLSYFPKYIQNPKAIAFITTFLLIISIVGLVKVNNSLANQFSRYINTFFIIIAGILCSWHLFSMM